MKWSSIKCDCCEVFYFEYRNMEWDIIFSVGLKLNKKGQTKSVRLEIF